MSLILLGILNSQVTGGAGAPAYDLLETQVLSSSAASVTFTGLGSYSDYKHLQIRAVAKDTWTFSGPSYIYFRFNSDSTNSYAEHSLWADLNASSVRSVAATSQTNIEVYGAASTIGLTNGFGASVTDILDFSSPNKNTTIRTLAGSDPDSGGVPVVSLASGLYYKTDAIASISLSTVVSFAAGSRFSLYGVK